MAALKTDSARPTQAPPQDFLGLYQTWFDQWCATLNPAGAPASARAGHNGAMAFGPMSVNAMFGMPGATLPTPPLPELGTALTTARIEPTRLRELQTQYMAECAALWQQPATLATGLTDRRFKSDAWRQVPAYAMAASWYLLNAKYLTALGEAVDADVKTRERIAFMIEQFTAAASPSNFFALNPDAQQAMLESGGDSLRQGMANLVKDMSRGRMQQSDEASFKVGESLATTPGAVVYENELMQLIQYAPTTATVYERPLLLVPPCINKFYILDLRPENSLVRHAVDAGHTVFVVSWRNADDTIAHKTWDDYIEQGLIETIDVVCALTKRAKINALGFCIGGTMIANAAAVLAARGKHPLASLSLLTAMLDFADTGVLDIFVDENYVRRREQAIGGLDGRPPGLMRGSEFASTFSSLRPNDLVWNYVVDNYLKGRTPPAFDMLYWNGDSTNLPGPMYAWYMRNTYLENRLREPGALTVCGAPIDLGRLDMPVFLYGSRDDHIVPWRSAYASVPLLPGQLTFVLGASGHIAGVINSPAKNKRSHWLLDEATGRLPGDPDEWIAGATEHPGSWWPRWTDWLAAHAGKKIKARTKPGSPAYPAIEPAPGRYVLASA